MESKEWYESKELWTFVVSFIAGALQKYFNYEVIDPVLQAQLTGLIIVLLRLFFTDSPTSLNLKLRYGPENRDDS